MPTYTQTNLKDAIWDPKIYPNISSRVTVQDVMNEVVRKVAQDLDMRSMKRLYPTTPKLFDDVFATIAKPTDMKRDKFIDLDPQDYSRGENDEWWLTTPESFSRMRNSQLLLAAVQDNDLTGRILISIDNDMAQLVIANLDSLTGDGGTWEAFGDAENVAADTDRYIKGTGSIKFDISAAGGTTAGIKNTSLDEFDYEDYKLQNRSVFVFAFITSTTNLTNYKLRIGSAEADYDEMIVTAQADGTAFRNGVNLLRFDFSGSTTPGGAPTRTAGTYAAIYMTKTAGKISETYYGFDLISAQEGRLYDLYYYSKYGWQTSSGTWLENSTASTDKLNADTDEFDILVQYGRVRKALLERNRPLAADELKLYEEMTEKYQRQYPSEALPLQTSYYQL